MCFRLYKLKINMKTYKTRNMKKLGLLVFFLSVVFYTNAQTSSVALPSATINPKPLAALENNGTGTGYVSFAESSSADVPAESFVGIPNVTISVNLQYIELTNDDISAITGSLLDYFNVSYDAPSKILTFTQKVLIPGDQFAEVFFPITVTQNSTQAESLNGINANINATSANTNAQGNAGQFTYTLPVVDILDDVQTTDEDTSVVIDFISNDIAVPNTGTITTTNPANGTVVITDPNGTPNNPSDDVVTYIPNSDFNGTDTFDYTVCDKSTPQNCDTATITVTVNPILDLVDDAPTTDANTPVDVNALLNDNDIPSIGTIVVTDPTNGTVSIDDNGTPNDPSDDVLNYTPDTGFSGIDTFDYTICDTATPQNCDTATVTVTVSSLPDYKPSIFISNTTIIGGSGVIDFRTLIGEFKDGNSNGVTAVELRILKNPNLVISFDNTLTTLNGAAVNNADWTYDGTHPSLHKFIYVGNGGIFQKSTAEFIGINAVYNPEVGGKGLFPLKVTIRNGAGGETNGSNNNDIDYINYVN